jgi:hypothetical protein
MITDRAYLDIAPATRIASYIKATGITVFRDQHGTLCVRAAAGQTIDVSLLEGIAAYGPEILALLEVP